MGREDYRTTVYFYDKRLIDALESELIGKTEYRGRGYTILDENRFLRVSKTDIYSALIVHAIQNKDEFYELLALLCE